MDARFSTSFGPESFGGLARGILLGKQAVFACSLHPDLFMGF
jgi:hypothetical protein